MSKLYSTAKNPELTTGKTASDVLITELVTRCSRCGKCRSICPIFAEKPSEPYVARGKVQLYKAFSNGTLEPTEKLRELISYCLLCGQCTENCSNGVKTEEIVLQARGELVNKNGLPFIKRNVFQHLLKNNGQLSVVVKILHLYQHSAFSALINSLPGNLKDKAKLLPKIANKPLKSQLPVVNNPQVKLISRVGYFAGCMSQYVFTETGKKVVQVLNKAGMQVMLPEQFCCGMPALTAGDFHNTALIAKKNVQSFIKAGVDVVVTDCATCGSALKNYYPKLLGHDLPFKVYDISEFLINFTKIKELQNSYNIKTVTYHDPCHHVRHMKIKEEPRELLKSIPGVELKEMNNANRCCGASGSFQLEHQQLSAKIGKRKAENIQETGAQVVATSCPSCRIQLERMLHANGSDIIVAHPVDLLL